MGLYYIITALVALLVGGGAFVIYIVSADSKDRRRHYKITLTLKPDGSLGVHRSKLTEMGRAALTIVPFDEDKIADIDFRLSDGKAVVFDLRPKG